MASGIDPHPHPTPTPLGLVDGQVSVVSALQYLSQKSKYDSAVQYFKKVSGSLSSPPCTPVRSPPPTHTD